MTESIKYEGVFFFQAEDGIRYLTVTGVQTCALPISGHSGIHIRLGVFLNNFVIPKDVKIIKEDAEPDMNTGMTGGVPGGVAGGSMGGVLGGVIGGMGGAPPPPQPKLGGPLQGGGNVQAARLVDRVQPRYSPLARPTRISGPGRPHAILRTDRTI